MLSARNFAFSAILFCLLCALHAEESGKSTTSSIDEVRKAAYDAIKAGNDPAGAQFLGWVSQQGEECGDFPVFEAHPLTSVFQEVPLADGSGTVPIQFQYSNFAQGPQGPSSTPDPVQ